MEGEVARGVFGIGEGCLQVIGTAGCVVPQRAASEGSGAGSVVPSGTVSDQDLSVLGVARRVGAFNTAGSPFADIPLIVEDLLMQARHLTDAGAPIEAVVAILDHVAALRERRY